LDTSGISAQNKAGFPACLKFEHPTSDKDFSILNFVWKLESGAWSLEFTGVLRVAALLAPTAMMDIMVG
jgi:hypothetical protein